MPVGRHIRKPLPLQHCLCTDIDIRHDYRHYVRYKFAVDFMVRPEREVSRRGRGTPARKWVTGWGVMAVVAAG